MLHTIIVEDDPMVAQINQQYFQQMEDIEVDAVFGNGQAAWEYLQANPVDLAILERAKTIAGDLSWQRRCALDLDSTSRNETILDHSVSFRDQTTFLECSYTENGRKFVFDVYYDQTGIIKIEYRDRSS